MTYKSLLTVVPYNGSIEQIEREITFAKLLDAHLDIVVVGDLTSPSDYFYGSIGDESWKKLNHEIYQQSEQGIEAVYLGFE